MVINNEEYINSSNFLIKTTRASKNIAIDVNTGEELWEIGNRLLFAMYDLNVGITYRDKSFKVNDGLYGFDLITGKKLWERNDISLKQGLSSHSCYKKGKLYFVCNKFIYGIDVKTGLGWKYPIETNILSAYDYPYLFTSYQNSNILSDSTGITFSTKRSIVKLDYDGHPIFDEQYLKDEHNQVATLFKKDNTYWVFNYGNIPITDHMMKIEYEDVPMLAKFDANGTLSYLTRLQHFGAVKTFTLDNDTLVVLHQRAITKYNISNGKKIQTLEVKQKNTKSLDSFAGKYCYLELPNRQLMTMQKIDNSKYYFSTDDKSILAFSNNFETKIEYAKDDYWELIGTYKKYVFITKKDQLLIINEQGEKIASFGFGKEVRLLGDNLCIISKNSLAMLKLADLHLE